MVNRFFKKVLFVLFALAVVIAAGTSGVAAPNDNVLIAGTITDLNGNPVEKAEVSIVCTHNGSDFSLTDKTNAKGQYSKHFSHTHCGEGDTVQVSAFKEGVGANSASVIVQDIKDFDIDIALSNFAIPEFGMVTGIMAFVSSAGTYMALKRRHA